MIFTSRYKLVYDADQSAYKVISKVAPLCPDCGSLMSGYDTRRRHVIDEEGQKLWFLCRRLRCPSCGKMHVELPDFMQQNKHYRADVIQAALLSWGSCPADDSTIRRWKK